MKWSPYFFGATLLSGVLLSACSSDEDTGNQDDSGSSDSATTDSASTASGSSDSGSSNSGSSNSGSSDSATTDSTTSGSADDNTACGLAAGNTNYSDGADINDVEQLNECGGETREVESMAADIFILLDKSTSMERTVGEAAGALTRWEALTGALKEFFIDAESQNLRVGLQYFGLTATNQSASVDQGLSCDPSEYAVPDVEIEALSDNAQNLVDSIDAHSADSLTPTHPALEGALMYTKQWAIDHPDRPAVLVLATDGYPTVCDDVSIDGLEDLVEAYANPTDGSPAVSTFVLGVGTVSNLKRVATKGGTGQAFFVDDCPTATDDLLAALKRVANSPAACEFDLPEPDGAGILNCDEVNLIYQQSGSESTEYIGHVESEADCSSAGGWYYSDDTCTPGETQILVCPSSCSRLGGGSVRLVLGCDPIELN